MMTPNAAIAVLREAVALSTRQHVKTPQVQAALVALKPRVERWLLEWFWECADSENDIGRSQNTRAAFRGMLKQIGLPDE